MTDEPQKPRPSLGEKIGGKVNRKLKAKRNEGHGVWFGLGMMGLVGWSVAVPTVLGTALGIWLDKHYPNTHSWTLTFLIIGLTVGCLNAWHWITREEKAIRDEAEDDDE